MGKQVFEIEEREEKRQQKLELANFFIGKEEYCVNVIDVREIIRMPKITKMPNTQSYISGIINLRGKVVPVVSIRERFGLEKIELTNSSRIIVMDMAEDKLVGFIVDSVSEVIRIQDSELQPPPMVAMSGVDQQFIVGIINTKESMLTYLDLKKMFSETEKEQLEAVN